MSDGTWRPLGVETEGDIAQYDALRDGVPEPIRTVYWEWVKAALTYSVRVSSTLRPRVHADLAEHAAQVLGVPMASVRGASYGPNITDAMTAMQRVPNPLAVADFLLAHGERSDSDALDLMLKRSRSAWTVGERDGHAGLVRRVPEAVGDQVDLVVRTAGSAGTKLKAAWEAIYGIQPNASHAYSLAIRAVEDVAIPNVVPNQTNATLGHVIGQMPPSIRVGVSNLAGHRCP